MQPFKELSSAAGQCAGRGCALIKQLANMSRNKITQSDLEMHIFVNVMLGTDSYINCYLFFQAPR